jgi:hypothetical protein
MTHAPRPRLLGVLRLLVTGTVIGVLAASALVLAQRGFRGFSRARYDANVPYDGRFTFARIRYSEVYGSGWAYDYPTMERNLMQMMGEITALSPHVRGSNIHTLDDPDLLRHPVAYLSEPGYWVANENEARGLREYLAKGGFLIVDDFMQNEWFNFEAQILRALPGAVIHPLTIEHPIFRSFFDIQTLDMPYPGNPYLRAEFFGIYENNDPTRRLMVVINYNNDIGDYMEWSLDGIWPVDISNEAYKFAINYIVYGMSH